MRDTSTEINIHYASIKDSLEFFRKNLWDKYDDSDKNALRLQKFHRRFANIATMFGSIAIILAIVSLAVKELADIIFRQLHGIEELAVFIPENSITYAEFIVAAIAFLAVVIGLFKKYKENWFLYRHKAELFRSLRHIFGCAGFAMPWRGFCVGFFRPAYSL